MANTLGFQKRYNVVLFCIFAGALFLFCCGVSTYLDVPRNFRKHAFPGAFYWFSQPWYYFGIALHLRSVIPCGLLSVFQFVPVLRRKYPLWHRINGYIVSILLLSGNAGALMIARRSFGGTLETTVGLAAMAAATTAALLLALYNIRRLQIDQHRAWMLRAMFYMSCIVTIRGVQFAAVVVLSTPALWGGAAYKAIPCDELVFMYREVNRTLTAYPQCMLPGSAATQVAVKASIFEDVENLAAAVQLSFGMAVWLSLMLHMVGIEIYLHLTPAESERLRRASYQKQLQAGMRNPGSAGTTADRWGDDEPYAQVMKKGQ